MWVKYIAIILLTMRLTSSHEQIGLNLARFVLETAKTEGFIDEYDFDVLRSTKDSEAIAAAENYAASYSPVVSTTSGVARGITQQESHAFYEIPFGKVPDRYQPPIPINNAATDEIDAATNDQIRCYQFESECIDLSCNHTMTEDCLVLNVYVPTQVDLSDKDAPPSDQMLPVMFYIHGGSFNAGAGTKTILDGRFLANVTNSVVVTINYRLGPFGFLVFGEGDDAFKGNQGIKDQQLALEWTRDNIANFGGDKDKVMIFGNSAGAQSVMFHVLSKTSAPLFSSSIQQSNPALISYQSPIDSLKITKRLTDGLNCTKGKERDCLLTTDPLKIMNQQSVVMLKSLLDEQDIMGLVEPYRPIIDGVEFTDEHLALFRDGKYNTDKDIIVGVNTQELETIQHYYPPFLPFNETLFSLLNTIIFGVADGREVTNKYESDYPLTEDEDYRVTFGIEMTHFFFVCPSRALARFASGYTPPSKSVYFYANEHPDKVPACVTENNGNDSTCFFAEHAAEIVYVFRTGNLTGRDYFGADDHVVEDEFSTYWGSFARTGDPSQGLENSLGEFTPWPRYEDFTAKLDSRKLRMQNIQEFLPFILSKEYLESAAEEGPWHNIRIKAPMSEQEEKYEEEICDFWDSLNYYVDMDVTKSTTKQTSTQEMDSTTDGGNSSQVERLLLLLCFTFTALFRWLN